jgi:ATP-dependent Clp protease protease subunit
VKHLNKFWNWIHNEETDEDELTLNGVIAEESWWGDEVTPKLFKAELSKHKGRSLTVWLNSPGGDVFAASQIYTSLMEHKGEVTIKIDGIAASAASVIAMAGTRTLMSPTSILMVHNPWTVAMGEAKDLEHMIDVLSEVKETIMNAYELKSGMQRAKISRLMDEETWMNAKKALDEGFIDGILYSDKSSGDNTEAFAYSRNAVFNSLREKLTSENFPQTWTITEVETRQAPANLYEKLLENRKRRLNTL